MRRLILHIGSHKTGTTAIQSWTKVNLDALRARGISPLVTHRLPNVHSFLGYCDPVQVFPRGFRLRDPKAFAEALRALPGETVLASSENFSFFFEPAAIETLAETVRPLFDTVTVICYLRRQDRHAVSHHREGAKPMRAPEWELWGHGQRALPAPGPHQALYLDYDRRMRMWETAFGQDNVVLRVYDRALLADQDIVTDFCAVAGLPREGMKPPAFLNESQDKLRVKAGHMINEIMREDALGHAVLRGLPRNGALLEPTQEEALAYLEPYRASNKALNDRRRISDLPWLFSDDVADLPTRPERRWHISEVDAVLRTLLTSIGRQVDPRALASPDDLRVAAAVLAPREPERALRLVESALVQRPTGKVLQTMRLELLERLGLPLTEMGFPDLDELP